MAKIWTENEETKIKELREKGLTVQEIADILNRNRNSVASKIKKMIKQGLLKRQKGVINKSSWTKEEEETLLKLKNSGKTWKEISQILGKTAEAARSKYRTIVKDKSVSMHPQIKKDKTKEKGISSTSKNTELDDSLLSAYKYAIVKLIGKQDTEKMLDLINAAERYYQKNKDLHGFVNLILTIKYTIN